PEATGVGGLLVCGDFFFSSRRRHTRSKRDWSSDVCSSDLVQFGWLPQIYRDAGLDPVLAGIMLTIVTFGGLPGGFLAPQIIVRGIAPREIGRASCRERV